MDKKQIINILLTQVNDAVKLVDIAIQEAQQAANEHKGQMESRYDSAKEEAQAMVMAQSKRKAALLESTTTLQKMLDNEKLFYTPHTAVQIGSIFDVVNDKEIATSYFMCPVNGGEVLKIEDKKITILSPTSPLGIKVLNKENDEDFTFNMRGVENEFYIINIK